VCGENVSANYEDAEEFTKQFEKLAINEKLSPEQVYNTDETSLFLEVHPEENPCNNKKNITSRLQRFKATHYHSSMC
jgi:hypothetical protein